MYRPAHFREDRPPVLHRLIEDHPLATLVTLGPEGLVADHLPMEVDPAAGPLGTLRGHVARANEVWRISDPGEALAIFQGPQTYVSPAWYPSKAEHGRVVPTWNYAVVHARGPLRIVEDRQWLRALVTRLTERHERGRPRPWHVTDAPAGFVEGMLGAIVGIEIPIARLEGKWKASQNRGPADRAGVAGALRGAGDPDARRMADLVDPPAGPGPGEGG